MAEKDKDLKPYKTTVEDAPDIKPSQKVLDEQAAGRDALKDAGGIPGPGPINPADSDPDLAAEIADRMNKEHDESNKKKK